jgi:hypothetical protein
MLNVQQILATYGDQYRKGILTPGDLIKPLYNTSEWDSLFVKVETESTVIDQAAWTMNNARFQKWQKQFLPIGGMTFTPNIIPLYHLMQDTEITPAEIEGTALDFLAAQGLTAFTAPILNIYFQDYVTKSLDSFHRNETFKGVNVPVVAGTSSAEGAVIQGVKEQFRLAKLTGAGVPKPMTLLANNAVPTDPKLYAEYVHALFDALPPELKGFVKEIVVDEDKILLYKEGIRLSNQVYWNQLGQNPQFNTAKRVPMFLRDCTLVGVLDMQGSDHHWMTVRGNAVKGVKKGSNLMAWNADQMVGGRTIWASNDVWMGYGFRHWSFAFDNGRQ